MNNQILKLIDDAYLEGNLTDAKKLEIINKGKQLGVDSLEIELLIENYKPKRIKSKKCPVCAANIPILSNVCEYCGTELDSYNKTISKNEILSNISALINNVEKTTVNNILTHFLYHAFIPAGIILIIATILKFTKIVDVNNFSTLLVISGTIIIPSFFLFFTKNKNIKHFLISLTSDFNKNKNLYLTYYTNTNEIQDLVHSFESKKAEILRNQKKLNKKSLNFLSAFFVILSIAIFFIVK